MSARLPVTVNVMLVEDERIVAFDLKRQLQGFGYDVGAVVASGSEAIRAVEQTRPDLVLMDIHLEGSIDGIEAATAIRTRHKTPVVFLTAYAEDDTLRRALDSRPFGYLVKPCEGRELHATIQMALARRADEVAVERSEERLQLALDAGALGVLDWAPAANRLRGDARMGLLLHERLQTIDEPWDEFMERVDVEDRESVRMAFNPVSLAAEPVCVIFRTVGSDVPARFMEVHAKVCGGEALGGRVVGVLRDVTQRHLSDEQLRQSSVVFEATAEAIVITGADRRTVAVNKAFSRMTGYSREEMLGKDPDLLLGITPGRERFGLTDSTSALVEEFWQGEVRCRRKSGESFPIWQSVSVVRAPAGGISHYVTAFSDVTAIYVAQQRLNHLAHHDALTGLPNRLMFDDRLENALDLAQRNQQRCLVLFLDLDGFKLINDTLGHAAGDELLRTIGTRIKSILRTSDTVARLGGDEFVILAGSAIPEYAAQLAQKVLDQIRLPVPVASQQISISGSVGIAVFPENGTTSHELMRAADMAMYAAKAAGRNRYHFFADDMSARADERMRVEQGLRLAIAADSLVLHYQPRVDLATREIVGVEALVRWQDSRRGIVEPSHFIAIAEESDLIEHLGFWVLQRACTEMRELARARMALGSFHLAVNVSVRQFLCADFVEIVASVLRDTEFPAAALELEITESTLQVAERSVHNLRAIKALGVSISIDDFGTGYSSLSVLRDLPIDRVKIDRSFITDLPANAGQKAVVEAIVALSHAMQMTTTVEGIERDEQAMLLQHLGCNDGQGFLFSRPIPFAALSVRLGADIA